MTPPFQRDALLTRAAELGASDLIVTAGQPPLVTLAGRLEAVPDAAPLTAADARAFGESFLTRELIERFEHELELDTRHALEGVANFRINLFVQRGLWGAAVRVVPWTIPLPEQIGLHPFVVRRLLSIARGLVLVTGPTGSGKSTTIASLLEQINQGETRRHIVTVEDPIEFLFTPKQAVFEQREVGVDTRSYARGLKGALRQMPHVIFVGEMRDLDSMAIALTAAETGNLVISTMATQSAAQTVTRIVDAFPPHQQSQVRAQLSMTLRAVVSQVLLPRQDRTARVAAREIMFVTPAIQNLIREEKIHQIPNVISTSAKEDMTTLDDSLVDLVERGVVDYDTAVPYIEDVEKRQHLQRKVYRVSNVLVAGGRR